MVPSIVIKDTELLAQGHRPTDVEVDQGQIIRQRNGRSGRDHRPDQRHEVWDGDGEEGDRGEPPADLRAGPTTVLRPGLLVHGLMVGRAGRQRAVGEPQLRR